MSEAKSAAPAGAPVDSVERLWAMTQDEVDELPYGFIVLDGEGTILLYNRYEAQMARLAPERVLGRSFFGEVAPCTRVEAFQGRFRALVSDPARTSDRFSFRFHFLHGAQDVTIELSRVPEGAAPPGSTLAGARVFMMVQRRAARAAEGVVSTALGLDGDRGRADGPLGPCFPLPAPAFAAVLTHLGPDAAREVGRSMGRSVAATAARTAQHAGAAELSCAPAQLAAGALDDAMACAGLGRVAFDLTARGDSGILGCLVQPAIDVPASGLAALYEGLLEAALGAALGEPLAARCLDGGDLQAHPWRFALAPRAVAAQLAPGSGERADDVARRLGLLADE